MAGDRCKKGLRTVVRASRKEVRRTPEDAIALDRTIAASIGSLRRAAAFARASARTVAVRPANVSR